MAVAVPSLARLLAILAAHHATARIGNHARPLQIRGGAKKLRGGSEDEAPAPRKVGCLIVGLGGNNGCTVLAGLVANRRRLAWEGQKRRIDADWGGCLTQRGELAEKMASFEHAASLLGLGVTPAARRQPPARPPPRPPPRARSAA